MPSDYGPWIPHDGNKCPPSLFNRITCIKMKLPTPPSRLIGLMDENGANLSPGQTVINTDIYIDEDRRKMPDWEWDKFGMIYSEAGEVFVACMITAYRVKRSPGFDMLTKIAKNTPIKEGV